MLKRIQIINKLDLIKLIKIIQEIMLERINMSERQPVKIKSICT